ncbi:MAG: NAD(P)/FAD-dependent oxidoreductase [Opitutus sp.]|nr:NAD(P)/FAD-dependent oxidoreductase [Opitutus sp.]
MHEVIIIGAGPAGLNAALILGRCQRDVLVLDSGKPRNAASRALHGFLTRDGAPPMDLRKWGRDEIARYPSVKFRDLPVTGVERSDGGFELKLSDNSTERARLLLLATGRVDVVPEVAGFTEFYGRGVYHCPYCDGWEHRDQPLVVYGRNDSAASLALGLLTWSRDVTVCADSRPDWNAERQVELERNGIAVVENQVRAAEGHERLQRLTFADRDALACSAVFFCSDCLQRSTLPERLGCEFDDDGNVRCQQMAATNVPGLFVAGNVRGGIHLAIMAAAEGAEAGIAMNEALLDAELAAANSPAAT